MDIVKSSSNSSGSTETLFFYDLETSGFNPRTQRIMQFAGQRTTLDLKPIGEPYDMLIQLTSDVLPYPDAIMTTGITPQRTSAEGYSERDFLELFTNEIATGGTIFVGFNNIRFDDEFMRATHYRNLYDPYEWQWVDDKSRWDLLDVVRMTRALRPDGIKWPYGSDGRKANRLELITSLNGLDHEHAHNAMSDVVASIEVARLILSNQPKLFYYLLYMREKTKVADLVNIGQPFVYTSGSYPSEYEKTSVVIALGDGPHGSSIVYDLRHDPDIWLSNYKSTDLDRGPIKQLKHNRCPAIAPLGVMNEAAWKTVGLDQKTIEVRALRVAQLRQKLLATYEVPKSIGETEPLLDVPISSVDSLMYSGFYGQRDKKLLERIRSMNAEELVEYSPDFEDKRLPGLFFLYKARQFPKSLLAEDRSIYESYIEAKLLEGGDQSVYLNFMKRLNELAEAEYLDADKRYILEELALYAQSIVPAND